MLGELAEDLRADDDGHLGQVSLAQHLEETLFLVSTSRSGEVGAGGGEAKKRQKSAQRREFTKWNVSFGRERGWVGVLTASMYSFAKYTYHMYTACTLFLSCAIPGYVLTLLDLFL